MPTWANLGINKQIRKLHEEAAINNKEKTMLVKRRSATEKA